MEELEMTCLQIITNAGEARSECMTAMVEARNEVFEGAEAHLGRTAELMKETHHVHAEFIIMDTVGGLDKISLILIHSKDTMMGTEIIYTLAGGMVKLYRKLAK